MKISREEKNKRRREANGKRLTPAMKRALANAEHRPWSSRGKTLQNTALTVMASTHTVLALERRRIVGQPFAAPDGQTAALLRWKGFELRAKLLYARCHGETFTPPRSPSSISECSGRSDTGRVIR